MLDNYERLINGVIKQKTFFNKIKDYDVEYVDTRYNTYGEKGMQMAFLRLAYLLGTIQKTPDSILDIGYGNGDFLRAATSKIKKCYGNDISGYPVPDKCQFIENIFEKHIDVICFFDVLEHFEDITVIKNLKCDYIYISLPHCHYFSDEWFENWKHRRSDEHLWHFNEEALINFFSEMGYEKIVTSDVEDCIRQHSFNYENILTGIFKKIK